MKVRELLARLAKASPDAELHLAVVVERNADGVWEQRRELRGVWVFGDNTVQLAERAPLEEDV